MVMGTARSGTRRLRDEAFQTFATLWMHLTRLRAEKNKKLFESTKVFRPQELQARQTILYEAYIETLHYGGKLLVGHEWRLEMIPACARDLET